MSFSVGQIVVVRADRTRSGPIIAELPPVAGSARYRVFHATEDIRDYHVDQLVAGTAVSAEMNGAPAADAPDDAATFRARLTAARLAHPQVDSLNALRAARVQHIPFQYKPVLRLLRADRPRLLIADEVGVGKTIEAGLILKELESREAIGNVLIVCTKPLVAKWRAEMRRFDEEFIPLTAESLRYCLDEAHADGTWPLQYSRAIVHLELLRMEGYLRGTASAGRRRDRPGLLTLDPAPRFDLLIVDEAHHVRNPGTESHELARALCDMSEAVVFLSATPVHVGSHNLFSLLQLLRPDTFADQEVFAEMIEPNRHVTEAMRLVRRATDGWPGEARRAIEAAASTSWGRRVIAPDPRYVAWRARLAAAEAPTSDERVRCLRDLEELHSLAHVMNRTRRRDIGRFTIREPHTVSVPFTPEQQRFYEALIAFRRDALSLQHGPLVARLVADTLERQAASCLPALGPALDGLLITGRFSFGAMSDDPDGADEGWAELSPALAAASRELRALAGRLTGHDPKLEQLRAVVDDTMAQGATGKLLVFSYFLHTLSYLHRQLETSGLRSAVITGRVPDTAREALRDRFRLPRAHPDAIDVLLSSEVGCEGLDYEFCDRLVNYDIPWNPMRVEQRIGRIDRFGQRADKVHIYNFITPGTVEERIFFRCYERLGVFRDTVGDLDEVLGDVVQELTRAALAPALTPSQAEEHARQVADNAIRLLDEQRRLEEEAGDLLGLDRDFAAEVGRIELEGRFVAPDDLRQMVERFLEEPEIGGRLVRDERAPHLLRLRLRREARLRLRDQLRTLERQQDRQTLEFGRWLDGDEPTLALTFDQHTAVERRELSFVTPVHPLSRLATAFWSARGRGRLLIGHLCLGDNSMPPGRYVFICDLWEMLAVRPESRLVGLLWDLERGRVLDSGAHDVTSVLSRATAPAVATDWLTADVGPAIAALDEALDGRRRESLQELRSSNGLLVSRKLASLDSHFGHRIARLRDTLAGSTDRGITRMKAAELARVEDDYRRRREEIEARRDADIIGRRIAVGLLEVTRAQ